MPIVNEEKVGVGGISVGKFILFDKFKVYYSERNYAEHYFRIYRGWGISKSVISKFFRIDLIVLKILNGTAVSYLLITPKSFVENAFSWVNKNVDEQLICPQDKFFEIKIDNDREFGKIKELLFRNSE